MNSWLNQAIDDAEVLEVSRSQEKNDWLSVKRKSSLELLKKTPWPTRKTEAWKYTPLKALENAQVSRVVSSLVSSNGIAVNDDSASANLLPAIKDVDLIDVTISDGQLTSSLSEMKLPKGLLIKSFDDLNVQEQSIVSENFSSIKPEKHLFGLVNDVLATTCLFVDVADDAVIENPIRISNILSEGSEVHTRVFVRVGDRAKVALIEQFSGSHQCVNSSFVEYRVGVSAELEHYRFGLQTNNAVALGGNHFYLSESSKMNSTIVGFGSDLSRLDVDVIHGGENALAKMNAIYLLKDKELFDLHTNIEHASPNGTTEENVRGIVADQSKAVFNGRIHIHRHAQKTLAELNNRNLLLSDKAEINTKPELEIYADDVKCAHGATIAEIDKKALYYLQTRGIPTEQAKIMLNFGFINELVDLIPNQAVAEWLRPQLRERFSQMR